MDGIASITANGELKMQDGGRIQHAENKRLERGVDDETSGSAEFSEFGKRGLATPQR
jgi:hypothetical protein